MILDSHYASRRVLVTGHTGFKGAWLTEWLLMLGADITGYSLPPSTTPSLFESLGLEGRVKHVIGDINDAANVARIVEETQPDLIFHLAAQPLVRLSYEDPVRTYSTNVMGTINVLEASRRLVKPCAVICITTDKCYENREWLYGYREEDPLGGYDPYSSSKAAAEIAISSWRLSFFSPAKIAKGEIAAVGLASVRAGNVIGGGDWALDRIIPDCMRALAKGQAIGVRNPRATRPWQHVLEPLSGYLSLGAKLHRTLLEPTRAGANRLGQLCSAFNYGPALESNLSVGAVVAEVLKHWPGTIQDLSDPKAVHEASLLNLATDKAYHTLAWQPRWHFAETIARTVSWYRLAAANPSAEALRDFTRSQINEYSSSS
jgi:CDP-glucose 4,6-dehydratase